MSTHLAPYTRWEQITRHQTTVIFKPLQWLHQAWRVLLAAPAVSALPSAMFCCAELSRG